MTRTIMKLSLLALCLSGSGCAYFQHNPVLDPISKAEYVNGDLPVPEKFELDRQNILAISHIENRACENRRCPGNALEELMGQLNAQQAFLSQQLQSLPTIS